MTDKQREEWIEEKARELVDLPWSVNMRMGYIKDFIRTIVKEIEDKHWATEQYHLDTIKELKKQLDESNEIHVQMIDIVLDLYEQLDEKKLKVKAR